MNPSNQTAVIDLAVNTFRGEVDEIARHADGVSLRVVAPTACDFEEIALLSRGKHVHDVTVHADGEDVVVKMHAGVDSALLAANEKHRTVNHLKNFLLDHQPPVSLDSSLVDRIGLSLCRDVPVDPKAAMHFESAPTRFSFTAPMALHARLAHSDLAYVAQKIASHDGTLAISARGNRLLLCVTIPISKKRKRKA